MGLRMTTPWKHPKSENLWFRKRVPARVRAFMGGLTEIKESLGTSDLADAKLLCQERNVHYERLWRDHLDRPKPTSLSQMQAVALAGELYREVVAAHQQNPGRPGDWERSLQRHEANRKLVVPFPGAVAQNRRYRYGKEAQAFLEARGLTLDHVSYDLFLQAFVEAKILAEQHLKRNADRDYTPDPASARFPSLEASNPDHARAPALATFDQYADEAGLKASTRKRWRSLIEKFVAFLGHDDLTRVTRDDIVKWKKKLFTTKKANGNPIANVTIRDAYIASIKATLEWLYEQDGMTGDSPAYEVKVRVKKKPKLREKGFTKSEAETILRATLRTPSEKMSVEMAAARRWVPWICAYTGARVNEITMLRPQDIDLESGIDVFRIRGDATKTDEYRNVPIHDHLKEQRFLDYVASRGDLPLFYDPKRSRGGKDSNPHYHHAAPLHHDRAETVRRGDIAALLERVARNSGPIAANRLRAALSALWTWGLRTGLIETDSNPVSFTLRQVEKSRERTLDDFELKAIWDTTGDEKDYSRIVRLCLLTGCRREEIGRLRWDEIQSDRIVFAADRMKGKLAHEIALLPMILSTLPKRPENTTGNVFGRRGNGFSGWSKSKTDLDAKLAGLGAEIPAWGLHDLRRTFSTRLHDASVEPLVIEALLAHKQQGVAAVYNRASFREAKSAALSCWHEIVARITG